MPTLFQKIITREIPAQILLEDDSYLAFLDIRPIKEGHTLVIPKNPIDEFFDLTDDTLSGILPFAKKVATALKATIPCNRIGLMVAGLEVPHAHLHLIPINTIADLNFAHATETAQDILSQTAIKIKAHL